MAIHSEQEFPWQDEIREAIVILKKILNRLYIMQEIENTEKMSYFKP